MAFQSLSISISSLFLAFLVLQYSVGAATIRSPNTHARFKRSTLKNNNSGPCLSASSNTNGAAVVATACTSANAQWTVPSSGSGMVHIFGDKCLDVKDGKNANGARLQVWTCTDGPNQKFSLGSGGQIQWKGSDKCLDLTNGATSSGTPIQLWQCYSGNKNQIWSSSTPISSSSASSSSSKISFSSKLGLAYPDNNLSELRSLSSAGMFYNWSPTPGSLSSSSSFGVDFLPQLWGWNQQSAFDKAIKTSNTSLVLGMNECNEPGQSNMDPGSGVALWKASMKPVRDRGKKVCSPAMSGNPNGLTWMKSFTKQCGSDCDFDYTCVHWYDTTFAKFQSWIEAWHTLYPSAPILITEFAPQNFNNGPQPTVDQVWAFYQEAIPWAMKQDYIHGVFPYGFMKDLNINANAKLMNSDGTPNSLGKWILSQA